VRHFDSDVLSLLDPIVATYVEVFSGPPWEGFTPDDGRAFRERLPDDVGRPGFRAVVARDADGGVDGFALGWTTLAPFRTDRSYGKVTERLGADRVSRLLVGRFQVDELAVRASTRGTGLGRRLLAEVTAGEPAWLLTWKGAEPTLAFYRRLGWREPEPLPGKDIDTVVFLSPEPEAG
jgi:GNAT superfamily N-acetyltransferase